MADLTTKTAPASTRPADNADNQALTALLTRRSVIADRLCEPGPDATQLDSILRAGARVPDHKGLVPWRFIVFRGHARKAFGEILARAFAKQAGESVEPARLATEAGRFLRAPIVIAVISRTEMGVVPEWEQILSAGAVCQNLLHAASALGFAGQWITEWYAYDPEIRRALNLADNERVAGFIYLGTAQFAPKERKRPDLDAIVSFWQPPTEDRPT